MRALEGVAGFVEAPTFYPYMTRPAQPRAAGRVRRRRARAGGSTARWTRSSCADRAGDRVGGYSHGMRQRLGIAAALLRAPKLLLLDEPATGLDPGGMRDMRLLIRRLADEGMTVLLSSHLLTEVEEVCNRVGDRALGPDRLRGRDRRAQEQRRHHLPARRPPTTSARWRCCRAQPGIANVRVESRADLVHRRRDGGRRAVAGADRGGRADPVAGAADGHARGPVLLAHRGRRLAASGGGAHRLPQPAEATR